MRPIATIAILLAVASPAQAQIAPTSPPPSAPVPSVLDREPAPTGPAIGYDLAKVRQDVRRDRSRGELTRRDARARRYEADRIEAQARRVGGNGFSDAERRELDGRVQAMRSLANAPVNQGERGRR